LVNNLIIKRIPSFSSLFNLKFPFSKNHTGHFAIEPENLINSFKNDPFDFNPGEQWLYNNDLP
jgi:hypothetical protein